MKVLRMFLVLAMMLLWVVSSHAQQQEFIDRAAKSNPLASDNLKQLIENRFEECRTPRTLEGVGTSLFGEYFTVGPYVTIPLLKYNINSEEAAFNTGVGAGVSFRYYPKYWIAPMKIGEQGKEKEVRDIRTISTKCRATTFSSTSVEDDPSEGKLAFHVLSISPTIFATKQEEEDSLSVQPALLLGVFRDIINIGVGYNLTSPDKGDFFVLVGLGAGFNF